MKRVVCTLLCACLFGAVAAQVMPARINRTTVYETFRPATIIMDNGRTLSQKEANIFLKNSSLVYKSFGNIMEADIDQIRSVRFSDRCYVKFNGSLACVIDTLGNDKLLCVTQIDIDAYKNQLLNERQITNLELREFVNVNATGLSDEEIRNYPLVNQYYFEIDNKIIKVQERTVKRYVPKENMRLYKSLLRSAGFSWDDPESLMSVLKLIN